jgi:type IV pilus assembly protein PilA
MSKYQQLKEARRNGEGGFTLIELLVVMVIIGLLAAIAIPLFLSQKDKARESAMKSDLRNAATAAETYAVENNGSYAGFDPNTDDPATTDIDETGGFQASNGVTISLVGAPTAAGFHLHAVHADGGDPWDYDSAAAQQLYKP